MTRADSYLGRAPQWGIYVDMQRGARRGVIPPAWVAAGGWLITDTMPSARVRFVCINIRSVEVLHMCFLSGGRCTC
jgi:hypothetical protein